MTVIAFFRAYLDTILKALATMYQYVVHVDSLSSFFLNVLKLVHGMCFNVD